METDETSSGLELAWLSSCQQCSDEDASIAEPRPQGPSRPQGLSCPQGPSRPQGPPRPQGQGGLQGLWGHQSWGHGDPAGLWPQESSVEGPESLEKPLPLVSDHYCLHHSGYFTLTTQIILDTRNINNRLIIILLPYIPCSYDSSIGIDDAPRRGRYASYYNHP